MTELETIRAFIDSFRLGDTIPAMEEDLRLSIGYAQRVGELTNNAEYEYAKKYEQSLESLKSMEEETETTRKAKLESWTAEERLRLKNLKNLGSSLRTIKMSLMQGIKTRRVEPY